MLYEASAELFLAAYKQGIFPMADSADDPHYNFYAPKQRALLPIADLHIPKKLEKTVRQFPFHVTVDIAFTDVIDACAQTKKGRDNTWINQPIRDAFIELHELGHAHSVECWEDSKLVGGLYGLSIGAVFCGESMFSTKTDASKIALIHLCTRLYAANFTMLDTQFVNDHLKQFGVYEIPQEEYEQRIQIEMKKTTKFVLDDSDERSLVLDYLENKK